MAVQQESSELNYGVDLIGREVDSDQTVSVERFAEQDSRRATVQLGELAELDRVDLPVPAFNLRDRRPAHAELVSDVLLRQLGGLSRNT